MNDKKKTPSKGCGDFDLANVLYQIYKNEYVCANIVNCIWYHFSNHKWSLIDSGTTLWICISTVLQKLYQDKGLALLSYISTLPSDHPQIPGLNKKPENIVTICGRCVCTPDDEIYDGIIINFFFFFFVNNHTYHHCKKRCLIGGSKFWIHLLSDNYLRIKFQMQDLDFLHKKDIIIPIVFLKQVKKIAIIKDCYLRNQFSMGFLFAT